jgi:hypothetical protein
MTVDRYDVEDWCKRWHAAREQYLEARKNRKPPQIVQELKKWEDRYRIAYENAFWSHFGRFPTSSDCDGGALNAGA